MYIYIHIYMCVLHMCMYIYIYMYVYIYMYDGHIMVMTWMTWGIYGNIVMTCHDFGILQILSNIAISST